MNELSSWVGKGNGADGNSTADVKLVQELMAKLPESQGRYGRPPTGSGGGLPIMVRSICKFQMHHFGCMTGRIEKNSPTFKKLLEVNGVRPRAPIVAGSWIGLDEGYVRKSIVEVATNEANTWQSVPTPAVEGGKQVRPGYQHLAKYFEVIEGLASSEEALKAFDVEKLDDQTEFPLNLHWCGIFAAWVLNQVFQSYGMKVTWRIAPEKKGDGNITVNGKALPLFSNDQAGWETHEWRQGDICKNLGLEHHYILSDRDDKRIWHTIEGNQQYREISAKSRNQTSGQTPPPEKTRFYRKVLNYKRTDGEWYVFYSCIPAVL